MPDRWLPRAGSKRARPRPVGGGKSQLASLRFHEADGRDVRQPRTVSTRQCNVRRRGSADRSPTSSGAGANPRRTIDSHDTRSFNPTSRATSADDNMRSAGMLSRVSTSGMLITPSPLTDTTTNSATEPRPQKQKRPDREQQQRRENPQRPRLRVIRPRRPTHEVQRPSLRSG